MEFIEKASEYYKKINDSKCFNDQCDFNEVVTQPFPHLSCVKFCDKSKCDNYDNGEAICTCGHKKKEHCYTPHFEWGSYGNCHECIVNVGIDNGLPNGKCKCFEFSKISKNVYR